MLNPLNLVVKFQRVWNHGENQTEKASVPLKPPRLCGLSSRERCKKKSLLLLPTRPEGEKRDTQCDSPGPEVEVAKETLDTHL